MRALVFRGEGEVRVEDVDEPRIQEPTDAIVRLTVSAICGTDVHFVRGTMGGVADGRILGHEGVGIVEEVGPQVRNLYPGDRVVIPSTIACGSCAYCRHGYYAHCDQANPHGSQAGSAFFGGPEASGGFDGLQAEYARIPYANVGPMKLPDDITDEQAIVLSDILPTAWYGAELAEVRPGRTVAVFGCGPVGLLAILSALAMGAGRVLAVDHVASRLDRARRLGAETIDFDEEDPVETIRELTLGIGVDRVIDAVGVEGEPPGAPEGEQREPFKPGASPVQALDWAVDAIAKAGTIGVIGLYPGHVREFPLGKAMLRNLDIRMGAVHHRRYLPKLIGLVRAGALDPTVAITQVEPLSSADEAYEVFDQRQPGWMKVELVPSA